MKNLRNALLLKQLYQLRELGYKHSDINISQSNNSSLILPKELDELKRQAQNCHLCNLSKSRTSVLFGEGNREAKIIFVGESPTVSEDTQGGLFIGRTGELLTNMIQNVLLIPRSEVYITNIIKCHTPNSQPPTPTQAHTCLPYIKKEIEIIKPSIVVTLGSSAYGYLTGESRSINEIRGIIKKENGYTIIATHHPSYLLRNPSAKKDAFEDMKLIKSLL